MDEDGINDGVGAGSGVVTGRFQCVGGKSGSPSSSSTLNRLCWHLALFKAYAPCCWEEGGGRGGPRKSGSAGGIRMADSNGTGWSDTLAISSGGTRLGKLKEPRRQL